MIEILFLILSIFYGGTILFFYLGLKKEIKRPLPEKRWKPRVTVLVPARNEAHRIVNTLKSLKEQTYPTSLLQVIIIEDHSTDHTADVVRQFIDEHQLSHFKLLIHRNDGQKPTFKKTAIKFALEYAHGEVILTTDADCKVQPRWVESMVEHYDDNTGMVAGLVTFELDEKSTLFHRLQTLEFAGLVLSGVGAVGNEHPLICNGSNLSYRRAAFDEVGGFDGHEHLPSGDDDLLMQNLHHHTRWKIRYNLQPEAINYTRPVDSLSEFLNQRARWASKSTNYPGVLTSLFLLGIYLFYLLLFLMTPLAILHKFPLSILMIGYGMKIIPEFMIMRSGLRILQQSSLLRWFPVAEFFQIPYIVYAGFAGFFKLFKWKPNT
ncbi:MAG: glycosyltransferase [Calditrichaeota bacterium]|nr:MAG: glycosyltransferase [Calditrichota bacterium]